MTTGKNYHRNSEAEVSSTLVKNWNTFLPHLDFIAERFSLKYNNKGNWKGIDILAYNRAHKRFTIIEIKKGKDKGQLQQTFEYGIYLQNQVEIIYNMVLSEHDHILLPKLEELNLPEFFLIAENFPLEFLNQRNSNIILAKYHWFTIGSDRVNFALEYVENKPHKVKPKPFCVISLSEVRKKKLIEFSRPVKVIKVTFPDGTIIQKKHAIDSFIESIKKFGMEEVRNTEVKYNKVPLFIDKLSDIDDLKRRKNYQTIGDCYIYKHHSTDAKVRMLRKISDKLKVELKIETLNAPDSIGYREREKIKSMKVRLVSKILKLTNIELNEFTDEEKRLIIEKFKISLKSERKIEDIIGNNITLK